MGKASIFFPSGHTPSPDCPHPCVIREAGGGVVSLQDAASGGGDCFQLVGVSGTGCCVTCSSCLLSNIRLDQFQDEGGGSGADVS